MAAGYPRVTAPDLGGRTILLTGASSGIGLEAAVKLASAGAEMVLVARDPAKAAATLDEVRRRSGKTAVSTLCCDFASPAAIRQLAADFTASHRRLDVLVNNAGTVNPTRRLTEGGVELTFAVNHLGYFLLTQLLLDLLARSGAARIVSVASVAHFDGRLDLDDLAYARGGYSLLRAYARSKLANVLHTRELARRLAGTAVTANCLHPGPAASHIWTKASWWARPLLAIAGPFFMIPPAVGADRIVHLAASPAVASASGGYYDRDALVEPSAAARDQDTARRLWDISAALVG